MSFTTPFFFLFLPLVLLLYWLLPKRFRYALLLSASALFYGWEAPWLLVLIGIVILTSYVCALFASKRTVIFCIMVCLGLLGFFKYRSFLWNTLLWLFRLKPYQTASPGLTLLLPAGISFYTFQALSYVFDVYRGRIPAERHLGYYALFVIFFPQLVAGPIERPADLLPQLKSVKRPSPEYFSEGCMLFLRGYAKKLLLADFLAVFVDAVFENISAYSAYALAAAVFLFAFQIYCDFSGYTDIARGCAFFLGVRLSENFNRPYCATSLRDFWHRWHMSLTKWFTDYLYIPLGGSRKGLFRTCLNTMLTFLVSGLWHGADQTFVVWGGLHGFFLVLELLLRKVKAAWKAAFPSHGSLLTLRHSLSDDSLHGSFPHCFLHSLSDSFLNCFLHFRLDSSSDSFPQSFLKLLSKFRRGFSRAMHRLLTFLIICFAWIFFRSRTMADAFLLLQRILHLEKGLSLSTGVGLSTLSLVMLPLLLLLLPLIERLPKLPSALFARQWTRDFDSKASYGEASDSAAVGSTLLLYLVLSLCIFLCRMLLITEQGTSAFLYFQF